MASRPDIDDLELVVAVARCGSIGAAARSLRLSQPAASARLTRLERRAGVRLFQRDTTGARPTAAGAELARQAEHILGHLDRAFTAAQSADTARPIVVGTFASMAAALFPVLDALLPDQVVDQRVDHGDRLIEWVAEGTMDAALVAIAEQITLPHGTQARAVGGDELVAFRPAGVAGLGAGGTPLRDREVVCYTYDMQGAPTRQRLSLLGATVRRGASVPTTVGMARRRGHLAVLPRSAVATDLRPGESVERLPFRTRLRLSLVTPRPGHPELLAVLPRLRTELGLT